jgi:hypothetical protein
MEWIKRLLGKETAEAPALPQRKLLPHEIAPELLEWEIGDWVIYRFYNIIVYSHHCTFLGILDGKIHLKYTRYRETDKIYKFTPDAVKEIFTYDYNRYNRLENTSLAERRVAEEEKRIKAGIENDNYNEFLRVIKEQNKKAYDEWTERK